MERLSVPRVSYGAIRASLAFDTIDHPVWTSSRLHALTEYLHTRPEMARKLVLGERMTRDVTTALEVAVPQVTDHTVLRVFWEEFKLVRRRWREIYDRAIETQAERIACPEKCLARLLRKHDILMGERECPWTALERVLASLADKTTTKQIATTSHECKICYTNPVDRAIVHADHACAICQECCARTRSDHDSHRIDKCPFCRTTYDKAVKLHIP
jgi:hypothetical protein